MRYECQIMLPNGICGEPAVDFIEGNEAITRFYLCQTHWDGLQVTMEE